MGKSPQVKDEYAFTLPFDLSSVPMGKAVSALERTKGWWLWFTQAQDRDKRNNTQLGTLGYLPQEIRDTIIGFVIHAHLLHVYTCGYEGKNHHSMNPRMVWVDKAVAFTKRIIYFQPCYTTPYSWLKPDQLSRCPPIADALWCKPIIGSRYRYAFNLPYSSPTIRDQVDTYIFATFTIKFECPIAFKDFFLHVPSTEKHLIRRMHIDLWHGCRGSDGWDTRRWSETLKILPPTALSALMRVDFYPEVTPHFATVWEYVSRRLLVCDDVVIEDPLNFTNYMREIAKALVKFVRQLARRAPNAEIYIMGLRCAAISGSEVDDSLQVGIVSVN